MTLPVYRKGTWISYTVPEESWSNKYKLQAASLYATALTKGFSPETSAIYAECWVNKQLYEGLSYTKSIEDTLKSLLV